MNGVNSHKPQMPIAKKLHSLGEYSVADDKETVDAASVRQLDADDQHLASNSSIIPP